MKRTKLCDRVLPIYSPAEETTNMVTHIIGGALGVIARSRCPASKRILRRCSLSRSGNCLNRSGTDEYRDLSHGLCRLYPIGAHLSIYFSLPRVESPVYQPWTGRIGAVPPFYPGFVLP